MGVVYDCLWYWRVENAGIPDPYCILEGRSDEPGQVDPFASWDGSTTLDPNSKTPERDRQRMWPTVDINTFFPEWEWFLDIGE